MLRVTGFLIFAATMSLIAVPLRSDQPLAPKSDPQPMSIGDLKPELEGREVTIRFTIAGLEGIAQLTKEGQAPSFAIEADREKQKNMLSVWIEGELANVLDQLQMAAFQDNPLKAGTVISAKGKLAVHKSIPNQYFLNVCEWQGFRVLPAKEDK